MTTETGLLEHIKELIAKDPTKLDLSNLCLREFPMEILTFTGLETLNLGRTRITSIPDGIEALINLEELSWAGNDDFDEDSGEQTASFDADSVSKLVSLPKLTHLDLSDNGLNEIPAAIFSMTNLIDLDLGGNKLQVLPNDISWLINLQSLDLRDNKIATISREIEFSKFQEIVDFVIDLEQNPIKENLDEVSYSDDIESRFPNITIYI